MGGLNWTSYDTSTYVRTAGMTCSNNDQTVMWGRAYPDMRQEDGDIRSQYQHYETYIQVSAPQGTINGLSFACEAGQTNFAALMMDLNQLIEDSFCCLLRFFIGLM